MPEQLNIVVGPETGTGSPPKWRYEVRVTPDGPLAAHMYGPRLLVLESLRRLVELLEEESRPAGTADTRSHGLAP